MKRRAEIEILADPDALARAAAERFKLHALRAVETGRAFSVALAGGRTPQALYRLLAGPPYRAEIPWPSCLIAMGDERHVPPEHPESNFGMVRRVLLDGLDQAPRGVCRFHAESADPEAVVARYETELRALLGLGPRRTPRFDLILLGLGADAHTASLFPGSPALDEHERPAATASGPAGGAARFTLTPPVLNNAAAVLFLVSGEAKARAVRDVLEEPCDPRRRPAQIVRPSDGELVWMLDRSAARLVSP